MDLSLLRTFLAVYRAGTVTAAAARLRLSQPTVTTQIKALESQLDQQLFQRLPRGVVPTSVADELAAKVGTHIDALERVAERSLAPGDPFAKPLHLAGPAEFISVLVVPALAALLGSGLTLRVTTGLAEDLLAGLSAGRYDMVLSSVRPRGRGVLVTPLADEEFVLVAAPSWVERIDLARLAAEGPAQLGHVPFIAYAEDLPLIRRYWRTVFGSKPTGSAAVVLPDLRGVLAAVVAGAGITVLPRYLCGRELESGAITALLNPIVPPINTLFLVTRAGTEEQPHIAAVRRDLLTAASRW